MNNTIRKYTKEIGSFIWFFIILSGLGHLLITYSFHNLFYDQTRQELAEKVSTQNDPQFEQWVHARIADRHSDGPMPLISVSDNHPAHGGVLFDAETYLFFIRGEGEENQGLIEKIKNAEHAYTLCIPLKYQTAVLNHLEAKHACNDACSQVLH